MIDEQRLRSGLQKLLKETESAIRDRLEDEPSLQFQLKDRHDAAVRAERTEGSKKGFLAFSDEAITQAAVHWLLGCVFVRFLEDNGWLDERNAKAAWISGPGERLAVSKDRRTLFLRPDPSLTDRDYLLHVFSEVAKLPGVAGLFDPKHNPLYSLQPTAQGAAKIVEFFQKVDPDSNNLIHDFSDPAHGTRFLGDLYQNLSESAQRRYALRQTPEFILQFVLDRTLTPAIDVFGINGLRMIDPACGSGHFLLAGFTRLLRLWQQQEPAINAPALVQRSLDAIHGVDVNPFATEISRFRLLVAALDSSGISRVADAPDFRFNLAAGDSLLHGTRPSTMGTQRELGEDRLEHFYDTEDAHEIKRILSQTYHVVVGNPPYINVADSVLRKAYRSRFATCRGKYQLVIPFFERFFDLAVPDANHKSEAGFTGLIIANAFMWADFGKTLIEQFLVHKDMTHVVDTSILELPEHGTTPTAIVFARNRRPVSLSVRAVRGKRNRSTAPADERNALIWNEILRLTDLAGSETDWLTVTDAPRVAFSRWPWSIGGGGAAELTAAIETAAATKVGSVASSVGIASFTLQDEAYALPEATCRRFRLPPSHLRLLVSGLQVRNWLWYPEDDRTIFPYDKDFTCLPNLQSSATHKYLWSYRTTLANNIMFGEITKIQAGLYWYEFGRLTAHKLRTPLSVVFAEIATHNHFVLDRGGKVFNQTAPIIKLAASATENQYLELLGLLNSSTAGFWFRQKCKPKSGGTDWTNRYVYTGGKVEQFPIASAKPLLITKLIQAEVDALTSLLPQEVCRTQKPSRARLEDARQRATQHISRMIALQEELDWLCYRLYGVIDEDLSCPLNHVPDLTSGERAFEIVMARQVAIGELETTWFDKHGINPVPEPPRHWVDDYRSVVERRIGAIESIREIALIEQPEYKRRWNQKAWEDMEKEALRCWLLDRVESSSIWQDWAFLSCSAPRDRFAQDLDLVDVSALLNGSPIEDLDGFVKALVLPESVPFLPILRYTESGLRKRIEWEEVWKLQRQEDSGEKPAIRPAQTYKREDFQQNRYVQQSSFWTLRGELDVPKERFVLYPCFERDSDGSPVLGWAGWSHLEQAKALATYYQRMRTEEGWEPERLKPILAGLLDLKPWLLQWHNEIDPESGERLGEYFVRYAESQCQELGFSPEEVRAWQPPATITARRGRKKTS